MYLELFNVVFRISIMKILIIILTIKDMATKTINVQGNNYGFMNLGN